MSNVDVHVEIFLPDVQRDTTTHAPLGVLDALVAFEENKAFLLNLHVEDSHRKKGLGTRLLYEFASYLWRTVHSNASKFIIEVDDCSSRYHDAENNIYCKAGFCYKEPDGPEMQTNLKKFFSSISSQVDIYNASSLSQGKNWETSLKFV